MWMKTLKLMKRPEQDWTNGYAGQYILEEVRLLLRPYHNIIQTILQHVPNLCIKSSVSYESDFWFHSYIYARYWKNHIQINSLPLYVKCGVKLKRSSVEVLYINKTKIKIQNLIVWCCDKSIIEYGVISYKA